MAPKMPRALSRTIRRHPLVCFFSNFMAPCSLASPFSVARSVATFSVHVERPAMMSGR